MNESNGDTFLSPAIMHGGDWKGLEFAVFRLLEHCGWKGVQYVGETGDHGADILGVRYNPLLGEDETYLFQVKAVTADNYVGIGAINQALQGQGAYGAKIAVVVTNGEFRDSAYRRRNELVKNGFDVRLWNGCFIMGLLAKYPENSAARKELREYQIEVVHGVMARYEAAATRSMFIVATGLGKTVIAAAIVEKLRQRGLRRILVLCHAIDLAIQLQKTFWSQIGKSVRTRLFTAGEPPLSFDGISFGLYQTLHNFLGGLASDAFDVIVVDEAHHAMANAFSTCIDHLNPKFLIGMTATPWRSDGVSIEKIFGEPVRRVSLVDGMRMGFLAKVDYRLMCDNINWEAVPFLSSKRLSIRDLNKRLFLPQRDDAIIAKIHEAAHIVQNPRVAVFSPSLVHAERFARKLSASGIRTGSLTMKDKIKRRQVLLDFSANRLTAITAVDVLNEGIDVPDINILVFLRATHSRRIFVQQLGRGLRISKDKSSVVVLDFVTDIRRIAAVVQIDCEAKKPMRKGETETVYLRDGVVTFSDSRIRRFVDAWLSDVAGLDDSAEAEKLTFPSMEEVAQ